MRIGGSSCYARTVSNARRIRDRHQTKAAAASVWKDDYWTLSTRPLHALVFLIPLVTLYELGSMFYLHNRDSGQLTRIRAEKLLQMFFSQFGDFGLFVPGIAVLTVLFFWHVLSKDRWLVRGMVVIGMYLEAAMWVLPLIVLAAVISDATRQLAAAGLPIVDLQQMSWEARATISVGAGIFEELLFRIAGISLVHFVMKDVLGAKQATAAIVAVALTALAFAIYHPGVLNATTWYLPWTWYVVSWQKLIFFTLAGVYFACIYIYRGFGVVVGTHAIYDIAVLILFQMK